MSYHGHASGQKAAEGVGVLSDRDQSLFYRSLAQQGCTPAIADAIRAAPCLTADMMQLIADCLSGSRPEGSTEGEFKRACEIALSCGGALAKEACPDLQQVLPPLPACADPAVVSARDYCRQYGYAGPDSTLNTNCWTIARFPGWAAGVMALPACGAPTPSGPTPPAPPPSPTGPGPAPEPEPFPLEDEEPPPRAEASTMRYAVYGVLGLAAIGGGYLLFGRKK